MVSHLDGLLPKSLWTVIETFTRINLGEVEDKRFKWLSPQGEFSKRLKRALDGSKTF